MSLWLRFAHRGIESTGTLEGDRIHLQSAGIFDNPRPTGAQVPLDAVRLLTPCRPAKLIGLWNNFAERAEREGLHRPDHPLYFLKSPASHAAHGEIIRRPAGYTGAVVFEAELGIVIGRPATCVSVADAPAAIFGYTCVNDVTARDWMRLDPAFVHWTRAKGCDGFGPFGPVIATGLDPGKLRVRALLNGEERQNYPVADMFFSPAEIVSRISHDMSLEPGDVIACGTSVGAGALVAGDVIDIVIDGIGRLSNRMG